MPIFLQNNSLSPQTSLKNPNVSLHCAFSIPKHPLSKHNLLSNDLNWLDNIGNFLLFLFYPQRFRTQMVSFGYTVLSCNDDCRHRGRLSKFILFNRPSKLYEHLETDSQHTENDLLLLIIYLIIHNFLFVKLISIVMMPFSRKFIYFFSSAI